MSKESKTVFCMAECRRKPKGVRVVALATRAEETIRHVLLVGSRRYEHSASQSDKALWDHLREKSGDDDDGDNAAEVKGTICRLCDEAFKVTAEMGESVVALPAERARAGRSLTALKSFRRGEDITDYGGEVIMTENPVELMGAETGISHFMKICRGYIINGLRHYKGNAPPGIQCRKGLAQFMNTYDVNTECNVRWVKDESSLRVKALAVRDIAAGEELVADYLVLDARDAEEVAKKQAQKQALPFQLNEAYTAARMSDARISRSGKKRD